MTSFDKYLFAISRICIEFDKYTLSYYVQCYLINHPLLLKLILVQVNMPRSAACVISIEVLGLRRNTYTMIVPKAIKHLINAFTSMRKITDFCFTL